MNAVIEHGTPLVDDPDPHLQTADSGDGAPRRPGRPTGCCASAILTDEGAGLARQGVRRNLYLTDDPAVALGSIGPSLAAPWQHPRGDPLPRQALSLWRTEILAHDDTGANKGPPRA